MKVRLSRSAESDLGAIFDHIAQDRPRAAALMVERLLKSIDRLGDFPAMGRPSGRRGEREITADRPYVIVYVVRADRVEITRIYHGAQRC